ncbi:hypothetical protein [Pseudoalteromonas sp. R3]|uniref:hypothetical protein n=1 Tax=Pseudoalteromonas sp. R3 TaxID=1709477 RepID=UPI000A9AF593|nr:hypothetical protein [Pseudoalteromonas sp. R3]
MKICLVKKKLKTLSVQEQALKLQLTPQVFGGFGPSNMSGGQACPNHCGGI